MKKLFQDIFQYNFEANQELGAALENNRSQITQRSIPLFSHNINAHRLWNMRINVESIPNPFEEHSLDRCLQLDHENLETTLRILDNRDLDEVINFQDMQGQPFKAGIRDILFHIANHHTHHRGQIISDLRSIGIAPPILDYIYKVV